MQKEKDFPKTVKTFSVDAHLITVDAEDDELIINSVELANGENIVAQHLNGPKVQYVKVDVPGDGSCQMSSFRLGMVAAILLARLRTQYQQGQLTPGKVATLVMEQYLEAASETYSQDTPLSKPVALPLLNGTMYDRDNLEMRHQIAKYWREEFAEFKKDLKRDVQNIIWQMLKEKGLVSTSTIQEFLSVTTLDLSEEEEGEWDSEELDEFGEEDNDELIQFGIEDEDKPGKSRYMPVPDEDFIFNALYYPASWRSFASKKSNDQFEQMPAILAFGVDPAELLTMDVPMGIAQDGIFAQALRNFVASYAISACVDTGFIPLGSLVAPELKTISTDLVNAYIDEFEINCHLWGTESSLKAMSDVNLTKVIIHTFDKSGERVARQVMFDDPHALVPFQNGPVHLYQTGVQNHFQVLIGPFEQGFLGEEMIMEVSPSASGNWEDEPSENEVSIDEDVPALVIPQGYNAPVTENQEEARWHEGLWFLQCLAVELYEDFTKDIYPQVLERLFRALAVTESIPGKLDDQTALEIIRMYEQAQRAREEKAREEKRKVRPPLVPMAGYMGVLQTYKIPLQEILCLLPFVRDYVAFHRRKSSWKRAEAQTRVTALKNIAKLLNRWADIYHQPDLHRGPSIAEFLTRPSTLVSGTWEGLQMRALLTIDPGELVGSEPEPYAAWETFNEQLPGYVRAHLLNKHLGGPGIPDNLAFLSSQDNTLMSDLAEEDVKYLVLEENKIVFYTVAMPVGIDEIHQAATIDKALTDAMVREVQMFASVVTPMTNEDGMPGFELDGDILREKFYGNLPTRVSLHPLGGIVLKAMPPDMETIGKLQAHWFIRMKKTEASSKQERLETYWDARIREIERQAHRTLLRTEDAYERDVIIEKALTDLHHQGVDEQTLAEVKRRLTTRGRETTMVTKASKRKAENNLEKHPKRRHIASEVLTKANIKFDDPQLEEIADLGKGTFAKYVELRELGSSHKDAIRNSRRRRGGQFYKDAKKGAQKAQTQSGLHQFFKKPEDNNNL